jgi:hypothetical protein
MENHIYRTLPNDHLIARTIVRQLSMRKTAFAILSALLIAGSTTQIAVASERHAGARHQGHHHVDYRGSYNSLGNVVPPTSESKPPSNETRSCDALWCYAD